MRELKKQKNEFPQVYQESRTIEGQSLRPTEMMKRHLAGTLPDIDRSQQYEYHYDENGEQVGEPLPLEYIELHRLAVALRRREFEEATKERERQSLALRDKIIQEYKNSLTQPPPTPESPTTE